MRCALLLVIAGLVPAMTRRMPPSEQTSPPIV
jgi:hypothetical protein